MCELLGENALRRAAVIGALGAVACLLPPSSRGIHPPDPSPGASPEWPEIAAVAEPQLRLARAG
jgi:hypothetical protein